MTKKMGNLYSLRNPNESLKYAIVKLNIRILPLTQYHEYESMRLRILVECNSMHLDFCALLEPKPVQHLDIWHTLP